MIEALRGAASRGALRIERLLPFERRWAETLFDAILGIDAAPAGSTLPPFAAIDRTTFWRVLSEAPAPSFRLGLRAFVWALTLLPLLDARWRRPFFRLPREARVAAVTEYAHSPRYAIRQMAAALKVLACFAYFDDPAVRRAVDRPAASAARVFP